MVSNISNSTQKNCISGTTAVSSGSSNSNSDNYPDLDDRHMNDSTLPRVTAATTIPSTNTTSLQQQKDATPSKASATAIPAPRLKVVQKKGFALHDWMNLVKHANDLSQRKGAPIRHIQKSEIALHNNIHDAWISLRGKVYNLTPYLHYHPGGVHIFQSVLGKDSDALFDKYHRWVNIDGLIGSLLIGYVASISPDMDDDPKKEKSDNVNTNNNNGDFIFAVPAPRPKAAVVLTSILLSINKNDDNQSENSCEDDRNPWEK